MRTMYDSTTASDIPTSAAMVAGYIDGRYAWTDQDWARFPSAVKVRIAVFPTTNDGQVLDVEDWNAIPDQAPAWVLKRRAAGVDPTIYCGYGYQGRTWSAVRMAFHNAGVTEPHYWVAAYPGDGAVVGAMLYPDSVAHQYAGSATSGGHFDLSAVADYWPGVDAPDQQSSPPAQTSPTQTQQPSIPQPAGGLIVRTIDLRYATSSKPVTGPGVKPLQRLLSVTVDGYAGGQTRAALGAYQMHAALAMDYIFGPNTASALLGGR